jgi:hypothetical protein
MAWCDQRTIDVGNGETVNSLWHCFGVKHEVVDLNTAVAMLHASHTALLPINCHRIDEAKPVYGAGTYGVPLIGHGDVTWEDFKPFSDSISLVPCLNINLQTSVEDAVKRARRARELTGIDLLKLEVLTDDLTDSDDNACVEATLELATDGFRVMPLISAHYGTAALLAGMDAVPLLRVMGSPIGSSRGIDRPYRLHRICTLPKPVILDGGIGYIGHILEAMRLGCAGVLVNSMLFKGDDPVGQLRHVRSALRGWNPDRWETVALANGVAAEWVEWHENR